MAVIIIVNAVTEQVDDQIVFATFILETILIDL